MVESVKLKVGCKCFNVQPPASADTLQNLQRAALKSLKLDQLVSQHPPVSQWAGMAGGSGDLCCWAFLSCLYDVENHHGHIIGVSQHLNRLYLYPLSAQPQTCVLGIRAQWDTLWCLQTEERVQMSVQRGLTGTSFSLNECEEL